MKLNRANLLEAAKLAAAAAGRKTTLPVLSCLKIDIGAEGVRCAGTDLDCRVEACADWTEADPAPASAEFTAFCVDARRFLAVLGALEGPVIDLACDGGGADLEVRAGRTRYKLCALDAAEFPATAWPEGTGADAAAYEISERELTRLLKTVAPAMSRDAARYVLNGVHCLPCASGAMMAEATDGRRLTRCLEKTGGCDMPEGMEFILPGGSLPPLLSLLDADAAANDTAILALTLDRRLLRVECAAGVLVTRCLEGKFPNTQQVIPTPKTTLEEFDGAALRAMLGRAALMLPPKEKKLWLHLDPDGKGAVRSSCPDAGEFFEEARLCPRGPARVLSMAINPDYLSAALVDGPGLSLGLTDADSPLLAVCAEKGITCVVMPMRAEK